MAAIATRAGSVTRQRIRTVKPGRAKDERYGRMSRDARYLFDQLISMADDEGRLRAEPAMILGDAFPYDQDAPRKLEKWLGEITANGMVLAYEADGARYLAFRRWAKHQRISRAESSELPPPPDPGVVSDNSVTNQGKNTRSVNDLSDPHAQARGPDPFPSSPVVEEVDARAPEVDRLCGLLADLIEGNGVRRPTVTARWRDSCRLLLDRDGRESEQVERVIRWCQADEFWRSNVLSMGKLREKFDQLTLKMQGAGVRSAVEHPADVQVARLGRLGEQWAREDAA